MTNNRIPEVGSIWRSPAGHRFEILRVDGWRAEGRDLDYRGRLLNVGDDCFGFVVPLSAGWEPVDVPPAECDCILCRWMAAENVEVLKDGDD